MIQLLFDRAFRLMKDAPVEGSFVEFGVYKGYSLINTSRLAKKYLNTDIEIVGFDTFTGMPDTVQPLGGMLEKEWGHGTFTDTSFGGVQQRLNGAGVRARLIPGEFAKLPPLSTYSIEKIRFAHIDADIYEGYRDALKKITPYVQMGTVMIFDEYCAPSDHRYQDVRFHGAKAIDEWVKETGLNLHLIRFKWTCGLCVIVDEGYLKKHGAFIERLRNDNVVQSGMDFVKQIVARFA